MYKLKVILSQPANYVYHMLSVSKVGYNNLYGKKYEHVHVNEDLKILKENENELTVSGGEHCGALYVLLVGKAASANNMGSLRKYYESIVDLFGKKDYVRTSDLFSDLGDELLDKGMDSVEDMFSMILDMFSDFSNQILMISEVMLRNIDVHEQKVWEQEKRVLSDFNDKFIKALGKEHDLVSRWELELGEELLVENFEIVLVNSIVDGAQANDISETKDIFNINSDMHDLIGFISHEIGCYIILQSIPQSMKEEMQKYWLCIESLATYHNQKVLFEDENLFKKDNEYFGKFDELYDLEKYKDIVEIIELAVS